MTILVIGNGFDLAHNLPTQYSNFLDFVKEFIESEDSDYSEFINNVKKNDDSLHSEIQSLIQNNVLLEYFLTVYEERCINGKRGWIDLRVKYQKSYRSWMLENRILRTNMQYMVKL